MLPSFWFGWPRTHEEFRYALLLKYFTNTLSEGILYPRWVPDIFGGYGYPTFLFYQPAIFFSAAPLMLLVNDPCLSLNIVVYLSLCGGALGVFMLGDKITGDFVISCFSFVLYLITPYFFVNLYVRGNLGELFSMQFCPWVIYFTLVLQSRIQKSKIISPTTGILALFLSAIIYSHPAVALFFFPALGIICLFLNEMTNSEKLKFLGCMAVAALLSVILSSPYWFTAMTMKKYVFNERALDGYFYWKLHFVYPFQFFSNVWGFDRSFPGVASDGMSFQLGLYHFVPALIGMFMGRKRRIILISGILYFAYIFLMTPYSELIWRVIPILHYAQFPWRILSVTALLQIICVFGLTDLRVNRKVLSFILALFIVSALSWYYEQFICYTWDGDHKIIMKSEEAKMREQYHPLCSDHELLPRTTRKLPEETRPFKGHMVLVPHSIERKRLTDSENIIEYELTCVKNDYFVLNQIYLPGWHVDIDGTPVSSKALEASLLRDGRQVLFLDAGKHQIKAFYEGPPEYQYRNLVIGVACIAFFIFVLFETRAKKVE